MLERVNIMYSLIFLKTFRRGAGSFPVCKVFVNGLRVIMLSGLLALASCSLAWGTGHAEPTSPTVMPFQPGEKLVYKLRWGLVTAGYAELEILPFEQINGERSWHFVLTARSSRFIDIFYKVRDRIESFTDNLLANSFMYKKEQLEGKTHRQVKVVFDPKKRTAVYSNWGKRHEPLEVEGGTIDPLASIYFIRQYPLVENTKILKHITDGKKNVLGQALVVGRENVSVGGKKYDTFIVEPDLKGVRGVFEKSRKSRIRLWITADERRLLVKMKSKVVVGSFTGTLIRMEVPATIVAGEA